MTPTFMGHSIAAGCARCNRITPAPPRCDARGIDEDTPPGHSGHYRVRVELVGGRRKHLVKGLTKPEHALFIEQELEKALGIQDRPVAGELRV
ncbi:MAG TPA: hypothetical protein VF184_05775 [Phycisphaeraceae bacterium]